MADINNSKQYLDYEGLKTLVKKLKNAFISDVSLYARTDNNKGSYLCLKHMKGDSSKVYDIQFTTYNGLHVDASSESSLVFTLDTTTTKDGISTATSANDKVVTDYAVKEYVADQISALESALELKGSITSSDDASAKLTEAAASKGDTYVVTLESGTITYNGKTLENGDLVIVSADSSEKTVSNIIVVERNLDGAVTAADTLDEGKVVLGAGAQGVKTSDYTIGTDSKDAVGDSSLATEKFVDAMTKAAGGTLSRNKTSDVVTINLTSKDNTDLGSVVVKGAENGYITVDTADSSAITFAAKTAAISSAAADANGLATAYDVSTSITGAINNLDVASFAAASLDASVLTIYNLKEEDGKISKDEDNKITFTDTRIASGITVSNFGEVKDGSTVQEALKYVYEKATSSGVTSFGKQTGDITIDTNASADGSVKFAMSENKLTASVVYVDSSVAPVAESNGTFTFYNIKRGTNGKLSTDGSIADLSPISDDSINDLFS